MKATVLITAILAAVLAAGSALVMVRGTASIPWEIRSWKGQSDQEKAFRRKTRPWLWAGLGLLALALLFAIISAVSAYYG